MELSMGICTIKIYWDQLHSNGLTKQSDTKQSHLLLFNGEPAVLVHHGIVHRWRCGS